MKARAFERGLLSRAVHLEQRVALFHLLIVVDIDLCDPTTDFGKYRNRTEQRGYLTRRRMMIKHHCNKEYGEYQAKRNTPAKLVPHREQSDFSAEPLALHETTEQKIRKQRQHRTQHQLNHEQPPLSDGVDQPSRPPAKRDLNGRPVCRQTPGRPCFPPTLQCD